MTLLRSRRFWLLVFALLTLVVGYNVFSDCNTYPTNRIVWSGGSNYCGGTGSGCTECVSGSGDSCVTDGASCQPFVKN